MVKSILTDSYFNIFNILMEELVDKTSFSQKNLIFCEEKSSLMIERMIAERFGGTFNTKVFSFGNYMHYFASNKRVLTKEGSAMVVKKVLSSLSLTCLGKGRDIAPAIYTQLAQLKSAGVSAEDLELAKDGVSGLLKEKIIDLSKIYTAYDNYLKQNQLEDQSFALKDFSFVVENLVDLSDTNVFIVGYSKLTKQNLDGIKSLIKVGKSTTAILPYGKNKFAFVNETAKKFKNIVEELNKEYSEIFVSSPLGKESKLITEALFSPRGKVEKTNTDKIGLFYAQNPKEECEKVASIISSKVREGKRYRDFTVIVPENYDKNLLKKAFNLLDVPAYIDTDYKVENQPLITLILSYIDIFINNFKRESVLAFIKNPLFCEEKKLIDGFTNYVYKYNVNYSLFTRPFLYASSKGDSLEDIEKLRQKLVENFVNFNVLEFLEKNDIENKLILLAEKLKKLSFNEESAVTEQIYSKVKDVVLEIDLILRGQVSFREYKSIFVSGVSALKMSIIPQYNDAVFVGGFKETAYIKADNLFAIGLTSAVPTINDESTLLSDREIDQLSTLKVFIEPKVKIVNHRVREEVALGLSAFNNKLYLSYPINTSAGERNFKSEVLTFFENNFSLIPFEQTSNYLTTKQGVRNFAIDLSKYSTWQEGDITDATCFYSVADKEQTEGIISSANSEVKTTLNDRKTIMKGTISPTTLENYYKCPFKAFLLHVIGVKERDEGEISGLSIGNIMHDIFYHYTKNLDKVKDEKTSHELFNNISEEVMKDEKYSKFLTNKQTATSVKSYLLECEKHCYNTYEFLSKSLFKPRAEDLEKKFYYPLKNNRTTLYGKVDRIDTYGDYFRVIDYKTGKVDESNENLYYGTKLQLYLYSLALKDKKLAGLYYFDVKDDFVAVDKKEPFLKGKTLNEKDVLLMQDGEYVESATSKFLPIKLKGEEMVGGSSPETLSACVDYALKMCENAVSQMEEGVIVPSSIGGECEKCKFKSICQADVENERTKSKVDENVFTDIINGGNEDA